MRVAIAGAGDLARYMVEEFLAANHDVTVLSRKEKEWFTRKNLVFRTTDYSIASLATILEDCDAVVSTILDDTMNNVDVHLAILEACQRSSRCKKYVPSEYGGNLDNYPDQPTFYYANHQPIRGALTEQKDVTWTLFNFGWMMDYLVPAEKRYLKDIDDCHPLNISKGTLAIPGSGTELVTFTSARDGARALARLIPKDHWEQTTYAAGQTTTWKAIGNKLADRGLSLTITYHPASELEKVIQTAESEEKVLAAQFGMWSASGAGGLPQEKVESQAAKFFDGIKLRTVDEFLDEAAKWTSGSPAV